MATMLTHDTIYSSHERVNVLSFFGAMHSDMNNYFPPVNRRRPDESIKDYLRRRVEEIYGTRSSYSRRMVNVTIRECFEERGKYHYTVWGE